MIRRLHLVVVLALVFAVPVVAFADGADLLFSAGVRLFRRARYADALERFEASRALRETARVVFNIAACEHTLGHWSRAAEHLDRFLHLRGAEIGAAERAEVDRLLTEIGPHIARLTVLTSVPEARVTVDGRAVTDFPMPVELGEPVTIEGQADGHETARATFTPAHAQPIEVALTLRPIERPAAEPTVAPIAALPAVRPAAPVHRPAAPPRARRPATSQGPRVPPWLLVAGGVVLVSGAITALALAGDEPLEGDYRVDLP